MRQQRRAGSASVPAYKTDKKIAIGVVNHCDTVVEPPEYVAALIRNALEFIPAERLVITTDCGFGREGLCRRIAYYKCVSLVRGHQHRPPGAGFARSPIRRCRSALHVSPPSPN